MGVFVKICGLREPADIEQTAALRPDALGFNFWPGSKRYVDPGVLKDVLPGIPESILKVGVFVDMPSDEIRRIMDAAGLDVAQLHGGETADFCAGLQRRMWKAVHLNRLAPGEMPVYPVDALLIDSYSTHSPGGTGIRLDWNASRDFVKRSPLPVLLAGGLTPENVSEAIRSVQPWGVDVSSGVEQQPGKKDMDRVKAFIEQCRSS